MRYAGIIYNDVTAAPGLCLSFFTQGCPIHCAGCHNQQTWAFDGGLEFTEQTLNSILEGLVANGVTRSFCIMGGEPLCEENLFMVNMLINEVRRVLPQVPIYIWSGYTLEELQSRRDTYTAAILSSIDCLVDGPYKEEERDITLPMRGSRNQRITWFNKELKEKYEEV